MSLISDSSRCELSRMPRLYSSWRGVELAEILVGQDLGEADDGVQRRAQLVGDIGDEFALEPAGGLERLVALAQRVLDAGRIGDVEIAQQRCCRRAAAPSPPAASSRRGAPAACSTARCAVSRRDDAALQRRPVAAVVEEGALFSMISADMRLALRDRRARAATIWRIGRVRQLQPPVAAEDGDRLRRDCRASRAAPRSACCRSARAPACRSRPHRRR